MASDETMSFQEDDDDLDNLASMCVSQLSIESFEADGESENELPSFYSLPSTPPRRRKKVMKEYASDNGGCGYENGIRRRRRRFECEQVLEKSKGKDSGESDQSGVMVITRPKGGNRCLCMDLYEVKACRDLGFELEHQRMLDTSTATNSPIANWRISSPGDDPRDVKARLKVWAQAVALASASKYAT